jgi:4-hydroxymandelate oxidase
VLTAADARIAVERGAAAVFVSNHGGRQLDGAPAALDALPAVVAEVGGEVAVGLDGGVRRGTDVLKALALGASVVAVGRPVVWGLAADGADGVARALEIIRSETQAALALLGLPTVAAVTRDVVEPSPYTPSL